MDIKAIEAAVAQVLLTPLNAALTSLQANPTTLNVVAQVAVLQGSLITAAPALEALGIKDGAALIQTKLAAWEASLTAQPAVDATSPVAAAPSPAPAA